MFENQFTRQAGVTLPLIGGAMYPCSNPELVAAVSAAGGLGIYQPIALTYVFGYEYREGIRYMRSLTDRPIGMNVLTEKTSRLYLDLMAKWVDIALEEGIRFFVSSLGNPKWIVEKVRPNGGVVYHDVTERKWALKALAGGVDGLIAVNDRAGGHAGAKSPQALLAELADLGAPLILAGGVGDERQFRDALAMGYQGVQIGTRLIASTECKAHPDYKMAIVRATEADVVLTDKISGVPVAVLNNAYVKKTGVKAGPLARRLLRGQHTKHWMRTIYALRSTRRLKKGLLRPSLYDNYWQAGKSVSGIDRIEPVRDILKRFAAALPAVNGECQIANDE